MFQSDHYFKYSQRIADIHTVWPESGDEFFLWKLFESDSFITANKKYGLSCVGFKYELKSPEVTCAKEIGLGRFSIIMASKSPCK